MDRLLVVKTLMIVVMIMVLFPPALTAAPIGKFTSVQGRVDVTRPEQKAKPAARGDDVFVGDIVRTKSGSKAEIRFVDESVLRLAQSSRVKINEYMVKPDQSRSRLKLFRGKIESVVKKLAGKTFGQKQKNLYEVQTPTAIIGVRGTDFFTYFIEGVSGSVFKEGEGYGYSLNRPDVVEFIRAGQALVVTSPDLPPVIRPWAEGEIQQHIQDTLPSAGAGENAESKTGESAQLPHYDSFPAPGRDLNTFPPPGQMQTPVPPPVELPPVLGEPHDHGHTAP